MINAEVGNGELDFANVETIILRFRDFGVEDTVKEHKKIISENELKYCWWGWWSKPQEKIPYEVFGKLALKAEQQGLKIFLFDSGNKKLHIADCVEFKYKTYKQKIKLNDDEQKRVPYYYRNEEYYCWFKFEKIEEVDEKSIQAYSYINVKDFFEQENNNYYDMFNNKRVCSMNELFFQQRTIWFVRKSIQGDLTNEISIYSSEQVTPQNYDTYFSRLEGNTLLWISDLHFSKEYQTKDGSKVSYHAYAKESVERNTLSDVLCDNLEKEKIKLGSVIISGDLTYKADKEEFANAKKLMANLASIHSIQHNFFSVVPGNHDFSFKTDKEGEITLVTEGASKEYRDFYEDFFKCQPSKCFSSIRRLYTKNMQAVEIIGMNSVALQQIRISEEVSADSKEHKFVGLGYVGQEQLNEIEKELEDTKEANTIRILVLHHHLLPVLFSETPQIDRTYSVLLDAGRLNKFIFDNRIDIVLHGHAHKHFYKILSDVDENNNRRECHIIGIGSCGVCDAEMTDGSSRMYGLITIEKEKIVISKYKMDKYDNKDTKISEHIIDL